MNIAVFIPCIPPKGNAQQKGAFVRPGKGIRFFKKKAVVEAERTWHALLYPHRPAVPFEGPVSLCLHLTYPWRKGEKKRNIAKWARMPIETRPDVENVAKGLIDVMATLLFFRDDSQIASLSLSKHYGDTPGLKIVLTSALGETRDGKMEEVYR